jgi:amidase
MTLAMSWDEWAAHDGIGLAERVRKGDVTAAELASQAAAGIAKVNPRLDAVVEVFDDVVADPLKDGMDPEGVFAGLPYLMKDLGPTLKGRLQEFGSMIMQGNRPAADSFLTEKLRKAGLNIVGRSTTPEFGVCSSVENALHVTRNPWDLEYTTCGSSAGTAAAVAAGVLPLSHATDGGGSIRIPAGVNGNIGLKVSRGVFSLAPGLSDLSGLVSIQGCHSRTVRDTAAFVDHCRGGAPGEFMPFWSPAEPYSELIKKDPAPPAHRAVARVGRLSRHAAFRGRAGARGQVPRRAGPPRGMGAARGRPSGRLCRQTTCYISNFAQVIDGHLHRLGLERPPAELLEPINIKIWEAGLNTSYTERSKMQAVFNTTSRGFGNFFQDWDIILTPITARPTPKVGTSEYLTTSTNPSVYDWFANLWQNFAYTPLSNLCGLPGISLPMAAQENGLPLGIQAQAAQANDGLLLQLAAQIERALGGQWNAGQRPGVHVTKE